MVRGGDTHKSSFPWDYSMRAAFTILEQESTAPGCWEMGMLQGMIDFSVPGARGVMCQPLCIARLCRWEAGNIWKLVIVTDDDTPFA